MQRFDDWEARLDAYLAPLREKPFAWGRHDCCTFTAGAVKAMAGFDPMRGFRNRYRSKASADKVLAEHEDGLRSILDGMFEQVPAQRAHRGDLVMTAAGLGIAYGAVSIHVGQEGERAGLVRLPRDKWERAWRVPMPGE